MAELGRLFVVVGANVDEFKRKMEETSKTFADTGKKLENLGKSWNTKVTAPVVALGALSAKSAIDFESAFCWSPQNRRRDRGKSSPALSEGIRAMPKNFRRQQSKSLQVLARRQVNLVSPTNIYYRLPGP